MNSLWRRRLVVAIVNGSLVAGRHLVLDGIPFLDWLPIPIGWLLVEDRRVHLVLLALFLLVHTRLVVVGWVVRRLLVLLILLILLLLVVLRRLLSVLRGWLLILRGRLLGHLRLSIVDRWL